MSIELLINIAGGILSVITLVLAWKIYRITKAHSLMFLFLAISWGALTRILIVISALTKEWVAFNSGVFVVVFWVLFPVGLWQLLRATQKLDQIVRHWQQVAKEVKKNNKGKA